VEKSGVDSRGGKWRSKSGVENTRV